MNVNNGPASVQLQNGLYVLLTLCVILILFVRMWFL